MPSVLVAIAVLGATAAAPCQAEPPRVVASILPVHSLVAGVMDGIGSPALLVRGGGSPHTYTLRPSEAKALQDAEVVFWIGDEMETFLEKPLKALPRNARIVALHDIPGITLLPTREGGAWDNQHAHHRKGHDEDHHNDHRGHEDEHGHGAHNTHVWLDPANAEAMVSAIAAAVGKSDPANAARYRANATALAGRLANLDAALARELAPIADRPYVVFHDAYAYFENRYDLSPTGSITVDPDRRPSAARLAEIREKIAETGAACVFAEPQFRPAVIATVAEGTGARSGVLDPLGAGLEPGPDVYFALMRALAASLRHCLRPSG